MAKKCNSLQMNHVKFKTCFGRLKPDGWKFMKLYARNYRVYRKTGDGSEWGQCLYIWQHMGGYLEIEDVHSRSYLIVQAVSDGSIDSAKTKTGCYRVMINLKENFIEPHDFEKHSRPQYDMAQAICDGVTDKKAGDEFFKNFHNTWREVVLIPEIVDLIKGLLDKKWIEVVLTEAKS